jgi:photosystem II oxygen-evolving enhancer protein 2
VSSPELVYAAGPKGFVPVQDNNDNYQFAYPFGWQEVAVKGTDVVYKDVIEPLESISVTLSSTDKKDIIEFGPVEEVCSALAKEVLSAPGTDVHIVGTKQVGTSTARKWGGTIVSELVLCCCTEGGQRAQLL